MAICKQLANIGASQCGFPMKVARKLIFVPIYDKNGSENGIALKDAKYLATWEALIYEADPAAAGYIDDPNAMLYPLPNLENVEDVRADSEFFEWSSGQKVRMRQGVRTFTGAIPNETPVMLGQLQAWEGIKFGVYVFDVDGNLICTYDEDSDEVRPIPVDGNSFDAKYMMPTYTDPLHIMLQYDYAANFNDKDLYLVPIGGTGLDFDGRTDIIGNVNIVGDTTTLTAAIHVFLELDYGVKAAGFKAGDFRYWDDDAAAWVTVGIAATDPIVFTENEDGVYWFVAGTVTPAAKDYVVFVKDGYTSYTSDKLT